MKFLKYKFLCVSVMICQTADAAVLAKLPTPVEQGGMVHINVNVSDGNLVSPIPEGGMIEIAALSVWRPGDTFDPTSPWYGDLDPTQNAGLFSSRYGLVLDGLFPESLIGSKFLVNVVSATPGLQAYRWSNNTTPQLYEGIWGTDGSATDYQWNTTMFHPLFVMPAGFTGAASVVLQFTLTDGSYQPLDGYTSGQTTLTFQGPVTIPEPSSALLAIVGGTFMVRRRHAGGRS